MERDDESGIALLTLNNPERRNAYDPAKREQMVRFSTSWRTTTPSRSCSCGEGGVFSTGADMNNAYDVVRRRGEGKHRRREWRKRERQRQRFARHEPKPTPPSPDRPQDLQLLHFFLGYPKATVAEVSGSALGGGFELALMADIAVVGSDCQVGMPATRFLGPALGSVAHVLLPARPVLARRLLLTGDTIEAASSPEGRLHRGGRYGAVAARATWWAEKVSRMPADGIVMAKEAFRLIEQLQGYQGEEVLSYLFHVTAPTCASRRTSST